MDLPDRFWGSLADRYELEGEDLCGADGRGWLAVYELRRQGDEGWRINGCSVVADDGGAST